MFKKQSEEKITYFVYIRKSSEREEAQMLSIDAQKRELELFCNRRGIQVKEFFVESASAYKKGRKKFNEMLQRFEQGEANGLLVYHLTRIARNSYDGGNVIYMMGEGKIKKILTPSGEYHCDNSDDLLIMQIHFAMAKKSSDDTSNFVKRDIKSKLLKGEYPSFVALGYLNLDQYGRISGKRYDQEKQQLLHEQSKIENRKLRRIEIDPIVSPSIVKLFELASTRRYTLNNLREEALKLGIKGNRSGKKISNASLHRILTNPIYYGAIRYRGEIYEPEELPIETRHFPMITRELFEEVQVALGEKSKPRKMIHNHVYRGMIKCGECGGSITSELKKGKIYYRCTKKKNKHCKQPYLREDRLEEQMESILSKYVMPEDFAKWALGVLRTNSEKETKQQNTILAQLRKQQTEIDTKLSQLLNLKISPNNINGELISDEEYIERKKELLKEKMQLQEQITAGEQNSLAWLERCEEFFDFAANCKKKWVSGTQDDRKFIFTTIFGSNSILEDGKLLTVAKKPFFETAILQNSSTWRE